MPMTALLRDPTFVEVEKRRRFAHIIIGIIVIAAFGPYVSGSVRTEQIAVYGLAVLLHYMWLSGLRPRGGLRIMLPWVAYLAVALLGVIIPTQQAAPWEPGNVLAGLDNITGPIAVMLIVWSVVPTEDADDLLRMAAKIITVLMSVNAVLAIISTRTDLSSMLRPFWGADDSTSVVATAAAQLGRVSGIFNQPAEGGTMYGIAGLLAIYVWSNKPVKLFVTLTLITIGGLLTVSKIFILGALPLILIYWLRSRHKGRKLAVLGAGLVVAAGVAQSGALNQWTGADYLARLFNPTGNTFYFYSAGRIGADTGVSRVLDQVISINPISGVGAGGWQVAYDSALTETMVVGGIIGFLLYAVTILGVFVTAHKTLNRERRFFTYLFGVLLVGSSFGFTPLTANRVSTIAWLILALLVIASRSKDDDQRDASSGP